MFSGSVWEIVLPIATLTAVDVFVVVVVVNIIGAVDVACTFVAACLLNYHSH